MKVAAAWFSRLTLLAIFSAIAFGASPEHAQFSPSAGTGPGLPETIEAIDSARVTTRILYITAHPDDESSSVLTYLARGLHADVALLSLTRGEGGQNDLGPEQAPQLGLIRTQELLAATRGYGVKLFFTRAPDFGFSKTPEETERIWGDRVLEDMVRVMRAFRPNVVINNFGGVHGGHGHHQAAGLWTPKAVQLAADPTYKFSEDCADCPSDQPWGASPHQVVILDVNRNAGNDSKKDYVLPLDEISPLWGKTWREIGIDAFANHRTQGITNFLGSPFLRRATALVREDGENLDPTILAEPLEDLAKGSPELESKLSGPLQQASADLRKAHQSGLQGEWQQTTAHLVEAAKTLKGLEQQYKPEGGSDAPQFPYVPIHRALLFVDRSLALSTSWQIVAESEQPAAITGEPLTVAVGFRCRLETKCVVNAAGLNLKVPAGWKITKAEASGSAAKRFEILPGAEEPKLTVWDRLQPEPPPLVEAVQSQEIDGYRFDQSVPVFHIAANSTRVDRVPLRMVPAYTLAVEPEQAIEMLPRPGKPFEVLLRVHSYSTKAGKISAGLEVPKDWKTSAPVALEFSGVGDRYARLTVTPPLSVPAGNYTVAAYAERNDEKFGTSLEPLPTLPTQLWSKPAQCLVHAFKINVPAAMRVGYITAENEPVPEALERLGIHVEMLDAAALAFGNLSRFNAIVVGIRAYELRSDLPGANQRLLDYVSNGGTLVVQYERDFAWDRSQYAPYPARIGSPTPRTTDEDSPVKFLKPDDPLLDRPNRITQDDFQGWVQERGLYYWSQFDPKYTALLAMHDPGESDLNGALVYAHYGKGTYIYTGIAFFRQLPEGVPGAYRLFVNLLCASNPH